MGCNSTNNDVCFGRDFNEGRNERCSCNEGGARFDVNEYFEKYSRYMPCGEEREERVNEPCCLSKPSGCSFCETAGNTRFGENWIWIAVILAILFLSCNGECCE